MQRFFAALARYNRWATEVLYEQVDALDEAAYRRDVGLYFKSVHGTLNHLLVGEHRLWFERFAHGASPKVQLDEEVERDRARLRARLLEGAARWGPLIDAWPADRYAGTLDYTTTQGVAQSLPFAPTLAHVFNHGTHHRGQISAALTMLGRTAPELDLVYLLQREAAAKKAAGTAP